jgi:hypothetical protein
MCSAANRTEQDETGMKKQLIAALTTLSLATAGPGVKCSFGQGWADGPIGEISSTTEGTRFGGSGFAPSESFQSPNVAFTPSGQAIEVFDPSVPTIVPGEEFSGAAGSGWITPDGRMNLQREAQTPEEALWAPDNAAGGWTDGPMGLQVGIDWLFFSRGINGGSPFAFNNAGETFSNADIDFDIESTVRYRIGVGSEYGTGYEFVAYDFNEFSGGLSLTGEGITPVFFGGVAEPAESYETTYQSRIKSYELNVWARRSEGLRVGYGLRHFAVEENYDITFDVDSSTTTPAVGGTGGPTGFFSKTDNNLFGGQIMLELYRKFAPGMYLEGGVKGMLLNNRADIDVNTANVDLSGDDSFITGGVNFNGGVSYRIFRGCSLRAGYEGVFIGSVATGASQSENNDVFTGAVSPSGEGLYYGGGYVGCTVTF